ncbi:helix-turn-helix domain-containing protein [Streptomyces sp. NPDC002577]
MSTSSAWEVRTYLDGHLGDPGLGPDTVAAAHHMSVRSLHKLFEGEGITVSRLIQRRRLQECARDLAQGGSSERTLSGVARRWSFTHPASFSRLFRHKERNRIPVMTKHSQTAGLICREVAAHGVPAESRDLLVFTHTRVRCHADAGLEPPIDLLSDMLAGSSGDETVRQRQTRPRGGATSRHGLSPASADPCGQDECGQGGA